MVAREKFIFNLRIRRLDQVYDHGLLCYLLREPWVIFQYMLCSSLHFLETTVDCWL